MKKLISLLCATLLLACSFAFTSCQYVSDFLGDHLPFFQNKTVVIDGDYVVITVDVDNVEDGATLKDYMDYLVAEEELTYEIKDGMITSIDDKSGSTNQYWMLYTSDTEHANDEWGTCSYQENKYGSATLGVESLVVKDGCIYIWYLQTF